MAAHHATSASGEVFCTASQDITSFNYGEGLSGRVWKQKSNVLWGGLDRTDDFIRMNAAEKADIQSVLGIPLLFNDSLVGVLVIISQHDTQFLQRFVSLLSQLEGFIGSEINRKKLESDLSHLYNSIPDIICVVDFQGRFLKINQAGCELLGFSEDEMLYASYKEFVYPDDIEATVKEVARQAQGNDTFYFENRYLTKSGEICWLSWTCNTSLQEGLIYATAKNITEEKRLRELNRITSKLAMIGS